MDEASLRHGPSHASGAEEVVEHNDISGRNGAPLIDPTART
jgi:hypothetical protein